MRTLLLMAGLIALFVAVGGAVGGNGGMVLALALGLAMNFGMYFFSDRLVLRMYRAQEVTRDDAPVLYDMVDNLRRRAGLPMPRLAIAPHEQPNAFATGRSPSRAVVAVTSGILKYMPPEELEGVLAHELAHVKNRDMLITTLAAGLAGAIGYLPYLLLFGGDDNRNPWGALAGIILAPIAAMLIQLAVSRQREFEADHTGALILGKPMPLARALRRLDTMAHQIPMRVQPAAAPLAQVNPLAATRGMAGLFSTHPPIEERIARLEEMARGR